MAGAGPSFSICVYCGSRGGVAQQLCRCGRTVGRWIGERGGQLVYGGGRTGLMGVVADATLAAGGRVVGVIPQALVEKEWAIAIAPSCTSWTPCTNASA